MKLKTILIIFITATYSLLLSSCNLFDHKKNEIFERVKIGKLVANDSSLVEQILKENTKVVKCTKKVEKRDEWSIFKIETEKKIVLNEIKIKELKSTPIANIKLNKKISKLEEENNDLRTQISIYNEEVKVKWENFQIKMNQDINKIAKDLNELK